MESTTAGRATARGLIAVYVPTMGILFGLPALAFSLMAPLGLNPLLVLAAAGAAFVLAWLCWSWRVPKWRLWALRRVDNADELHMRAVASGLEWPYGSIFERTEIRSAEHLRQETALQLRAYLRLARALLAEGEARRALEQVELVLPAVEAAARGEPAAVPDLHPLRWAIGELLRQPAGLPPKLARVLAGAAHFAARWGQVAARPT